MTLREKLCEPFGGLLNETVNELEKIVDEFAINFTEWCGDKRIVFLPTKGWYFGSYEIEMGIFKTTKELLETYKKETGL